MKLDNKTNYSSNVQEPSFSNLNEKGKRKRKLSGIIKGIIIIIIGVFIGSSIGEAGKVSSDEHNKIINEYDASIKNLENKENELKALKDRTKELDTYLKQ